MIFLTAYTLKYADEARQCVDAAASVGVTVKAVPLPDLGSWRKNCAQKPSVVAKQLNTHPVVWIDADARMRKYPDELFGLKDYDVAVHYRNGHELLSSLIWFAPTAKQLVMDWRESCEQYINDEEMQKHVLFEQQELQRLIDQSGLRVLRLPSTYARIFDDPSMGDPVIEQMQASRRLS